MAVEAEVVVRTVALVRRGRSGLEQLVTFSTAGAGPALRGPVVVVLPGHREPVPCPLEEDPACSAGPGGLASWVPVQQREAEAEFLVGSGEALLRCRARLGPPRPWEVHLVHFSHHDIGYTDVPHACLDLHLGYLDRLIEICRDTRRLPFESRFRWTCDTTWPLKEWVARRPAATVRRLLDLVRQGRIEITAQYVAFNSALPDVEELIRSLAFAFELKRRHGMPLASAMTTDIPGYPWIYPQLLAASGIRYLMTSVNALWAQGGKPRAKEPRLAKPFWWVGPDGSRVLVWNTGPDANYGSEGEDLGFYEGPAKILARLPGHLAGREADGYPWDITSLRVGTDNKPPDPRLCEWVRGWNERFVHPRLVMSTPTLFLGTLERSVGRRPGAEFPACRGDWTDWWMDGPASSAFETAISRRVRPMLLASGALRAVTGAGGDGSAALIRERAWDELMLYDEHTWGMWDNVLAPFSSSTRHHWLLKAAHVYEAERLAGGLLRDASAPLVRRAAGPAPCIVVFNPLGWNRTEPVRAVVPDSLLAPLGDDWGLVERGTGRVVPHQVAGRTQHWSWRVESTLAFVAGDVPALGWRIYDLVPGARRQVGTTLRIEGLRLENGSYRAELDPDTGGVRSLYDKELGIELVDAEGGLRLNGYLYDEGEPPDNVRHRPSGARVAARGDGPVFARLAASSSCHTTPRLEQEVLLYEGLRRVEFANVLWKTETLRKEGVYFAFPCAVPGGSFRLDVPGAVMVPGPDQLPGSCMDWHAVQHWLDVSNTRHGVTWSSPEIPVVSLGDINTGRWQDAPSAGSSFFAYAMNNYWDTNFKESQGGEFRFTFVLTSHGAPLDPVAAARFGAGCCRPLLALPVPAVAPGPARPSSGASDGEAFIRIGDTGARLESLQPSRDGAGLILRILETSGGSRTARVELPLVRPTRACRTSPMEEGCEPLAIRDGAIEVPLKPHELLTVRVDLR